MENLTHLLAQDQSIFIGYSTYQRLIEDLIRNQSQFKGDSNIDISLFDEETIKDKVTNKVKECLEKNFDVESCLKSFQKKEQPKDDFDYETMTKYLFHVVLLTLVGVFGCIGNASIVIMFARIKKQLTLCSIFLFFHGIR